MFLAADRWTGGQLVVKYFGRLDDEAEGEQQRQLGKELSLLTAAGHVRPSTLDNILKVDDQKIRSSD